MAYKFQIGAARLSGSIIQTDGTGDLKATTVDSLVSEGVVTATGVVSSSADGRFLALDINGTEAISSARAGDLASLALNAGGITAAGAIAGATSIDASGDLTVGSITNAEFSVDSSGNTDIDGILNVQGVSTFQAQSVHSLGATFAAGGLAACGAIAGATTVTATGNVSSSADGRFLALKINSNTAIDSTRAGDLIS